MVVLLITTSYGCMALKLNSTLQYFIEQFKRISNYILHLRYASLLARFESNSFEIEVSEPLYKFE